MNKYDVFAPYIDKGLVDEFLDISRNEVFEDGGGGTSRCRLVGDYALLLSKLFKETGVTRLEFENTMRELYSHFQNGAKVAPVLAYVHSDKGILNRNYPDKLRDLIILKRAEGVKIGNSTLNQTRDRLLSSASNYDELVSTFMTLLDSPLWLDISKNNLMFDKNCGFQFIDFNKLDRNAKNRDMLKRVNFNTARLLRSFVSTKKRVLKEKAYLPLAVNEQRVLVSKLYKQGVPECVLINALKGIPELGCASLTELFC